MSFGQAIARYRQRPRFALACVLALVLALMPWRWPLPVAVAGVDAVFAGAVCSTANAAQPQPDGVVGSVHDCCLACHALALASPGIELPKRVGPPDTVRLASQLSHGSGSDGAWFSRGPPV